MSKQASNSTVEEKVFLFKVDSPPERRARPKRAMMKVVTIDLKKHNLSISAALTTDGDFFGHDFGRCNFQIRVFIV